MSGQPSIRPTPHVLILHDIVGMEMIGKWEHCISLSCGFILPSKRVKTIVAIS
jgi:hypothetical protein